MTKNKLLYMLGRNEDSILTFKLTPEERKFILEKELKTNPDAQPQYKLDIGCTTNFNNEYIRKLRKRKFNTNGNVLVFSWTENRFRIIAPHMVTNVTPLASILRNESPEVRYNG